MVTLNYIELFAGCGGLSLGLESIGNFQMVMANELSPMPAQTYAYNFFNEDLEQITTSSENVKWLSSQYPKNNTIDRLREDPRQYPALNAEDRHSDLNKSASLHGKLVVADIRQLNQFLTIHPNIAKDLSEAYGNGSLELVSGGPPCQSFSMAGLRQRDNDRNTLPWEFAKFVNMVQPKFTILENVTGILRAFKEDDGSLHYAWKEVAGTFCTIGYIPLCLHVNAKYVGAPQNRPRFIMIGIREDIYRNLSNTLTAIEKEIFSPFEKCFEAIKSGNNLTDNTKALEHLIYYDVAKQTDIGLFINSFLSPLVTKTEPFVSVCEAIDDLRFNELNLKPSDYINKNANLLSKGVIVPRNKIANHEPRSNGALVQRRFRIYQVMQKVEPKLSKEVKSILKGDLNNLSYEAWSAFSKYDYLNENGNFSVFEEQSDFIEFLQRHTTKKQTQKALVADQPAPAALSIPDDACHYHHDELRTLTVREMARIQSFPDSFVFKSKVTTGGQMRKFEVPQYTQVGNAVPPMLGRALGLVIQNLDNRLN